jgi:hypothetical protein
VTIGWEISLHSDPVGEHGGDFLNRTLRERGFLVMGVSLCRGPVGDPGEGVHLQGNMRDSEGELRKWSVSHFGCSVGESRGQCSSAGNPEGYGEEGSGDRHFSLWGPRWGAW